MAVGSGSEQIYKCIFVSAEFPLPRIVQRNNIVSRTMYSVGLVAVSL